eukprot:TRINITY_DN43998_c0_g1_i1.p1 TRINITY_DN43998_c0_g1~~TRINITY_DN43998_c0_g1_i1.p1  ORF type:complete len:911 (+),score=182.86 TRINITY_DN43998_c0_g1_i1:95-2827(+)
MSELRVLMVAEKPAIAQTLSAALGGTAVTKRTGISPRSPVYEYAGTFRGEKAKFKVTATFGHVYSLEFGDEWHKSTPSELFTAPVIRSYDSQARLPEHMKAEAAGCNVLVLWLDCDREGENICFEVIGDTFSMMDRSRSFDGAFRGCIFRAKFSSLSEGNLRQAMTNLSVPNVNLSHSVDARSEIDLRLGLAFSKFQTQYFRNHPQLGGYARSVTYGPCQIPTLWFCVHRYCQIKEFVAKSFWRLGITLSRNQMQFPAEAACGQMWDETEARRLLLKVRSLTEARVTAIERRDKILQRPQPLTTVTMLQEASNRAQMSPGDALYYAEQLYLKGILSYPRTETSKYPEGFDVAGVLQALQAPAAPWAAEAARVATMQIAARQDGVDHGDHSPITPVKWATEAQCGDPNAWAMYQLVCRHFLATIAPDCVVKEIEVKLDFGGVPLKAKSSRRAPGAFTWCEVIGEEIKDEGAVDLADLLSQGASCSMVAAALQEHATRPPPHLSESDLLGLMEEHGIGTDASMASHIANVLKRGYVGLDVKTRQLMPKALGMALALAYTIVDSTLVKPTVRSTIENACTRVAKGEAKKEDVVASSLDMFKQKFTIFCENVDKVPAMLAVAFSRSSRDHGTLLCDIPQGAAEQWDAAVRKTAAVSLEDLLRERASCVLGEEANGLGDRSGGTAVQELRPGLKAHIHGSTSAPQLNGQEVVCKSFDNILGRWHVQLPSGEVKALRAENLRVGGSDSINSLQIGAVVRIGGLKGAAHLNGQEGVCKSLDANTGRWVVQLHNGESKALKPENLQVSLKRPGDNHGSQSKKPKVDERADLKQRVFRCCDTDQDGFLNKKEMLSFASLTGFEGSAELWDAAYRKLCQDCCANAEEGISEGTLLALIDDQSDSGFYCTDRELREFIRFS